MLCFSWRSVFRLTGAARLDLRLVKRKQILPIAREVRSVDLNVEKSNRGKIKNPVTALYRRDYFVSFEEINAAILQRRPVERQDRDLRFSSTDHDHVFARQAFGEVEAAGDVAKVGGAFSVIGQDCSVARAVPPQLQPGRDGEAETAKPAARSRVAGMIGIQVARLIRQTQIGRAINDDD